VFLLIISLVVWQEARRRPSYEPLEYVIEDAVEHAYERLSEESSLTKADVRRILEWEVFYLQGLAQDDRSNPVETVAGGHEASVEYIVSQIRAKHAVSYPPDDVQSVLSLEADYLMAIGAVGEPVDQGEEEE
jgi:hypothetical protein